MRLSDVLHLPKEMHSLSIIKDYLALPLSHQEHQAALSHYFDVALEVKQYALVYDEGMAILKDINLQEETPHQEKIIKHIIDAALNLGHYDQVEALITRRKEKLPIIKQYAALIDQVLYKKALKQPYLEDLFMIMSDTIPDDITIYCLKEIYHVYRSESQYDKALETLYQLYQFDLIHLFEEDEYELLCYLKRYDDVISKAVSVIKQGHIKPKIIVALIESYLAVGDVHKAITLEADYESYIDAQEDDIRQKAYQLLVELYGKENNKLSLDIYQKKLKSLQRQIDKKDIKPKVKVVEDKPFEEPKEATKAKAKDTLKRLDMFQSLLFYSHQIDHKLKLRDYLRVLFIEIEKHIAFKEAYMVLNQVEPNFYFYKKERLYDKNLFDNDLKNSIVPLIHQTKDEIYEKPQALKHQLNLITQKNYESDITFIYAFPMGDLGVFVVHLDQEVHDPGAFYDDFKFIATLIYAKVTDEAHMKSLKNDLYIYEKMIQSDLLAIRMHTRIRSTYNQKAQTLFGIEAHQHLELFLRDVQYDDVRNVQQAIDYLMTHPNEMKDVIYHYQNKTIVETMISFKSQDQIVLVSLFDDQSVAVEKKEKLIEKATLDAQTGLLNLHALTEDLNDHLKDKASLILIELGGDLKHIYGGVDALNYFKEFGQLTKRFFSEGTTYRKDYDQLLVIVPINDIRTVTKMIKDYLKMILKTTSVVLPYEKFQPNMTILRYPVVTSEKKKSKLLHFLDIGIEKVKRLKHDTYDFFVYRDYEEEVFEQQVIHYLNEAIEHKQLALVFNQITDIKKNKIWQYESELSLPNLSISNHYLLTLAKKRHRLVDLEKYHIDLVCQFLVYLEKETERLIKITIPISKETFTESTFNTYLLERLKFYQMPHEFIRLKLDLDIQGRYSAQILELIDHGLSVDTTSLKTALNYPVTALHMTLEKESLKSLSYMSKIKSLCDQFMMAYIIRGVKTKDQKDALERIGVTYLEGSLYKQLKSDVLVTKIKENL